MRITPFALATLAVLLSATAAGAADCRADPAPAIDWQECNKALVWALVAECPLRRQATELPK